MKLTEKQRIFCIEYLKDLNGTRAYKVAYPHVKNDNTAAAAASRLLRNVKIKSFIDKKLKEIEDKKIAKAEEVLKYLTSVMRGEETEEVVVVEGIGEGMSSATTIKKQVGARERIKAAELLGKRYALFTEKVDIEGNMGVVIVDDIEEDGSDEED
ncbi:terminase small subunit [Tepidimicrobium xylanilyticum]|uniref:Phage terminase small subunit n=1 Tax=Tepidimicrobium xylanilyticum TaxID=1123352 RepID=A0A1H3FA22_9FIRM|nr:terminase small subunit [Tepidimicrobium xylanilyticum]SDX87811.1 phage terminase small subunit [Tepidimicrobium xylanilyticum]